MQFFVAQKKLDFEQPDWSKAPELYVIHQILEQRLDIIDLASPCFLNLNQKNTIGRTGMTLEQVVRCAFYMRYHAITYRELARAIVDCKMCIVFTHMDYGQSFSYQTLQENISKISPEILENMNIEICKMSMEFGLENGKRMRTDSTAVETNIHKPTNCSHLWDCIRVACRILRKVKTLFEPVKVSIYSQKTAKKLTIKIVNTRGQENRIHLFKKMLRIQKKFMDQVACAIKQLHAISFEDESLEKERKEYLRELENLHPKMEKVYDVAYRKEILNEAVPVGEKIFSIFEDHTDCIVKGFRNSIFGHKVNLTTSKKNFIFDVIIEKGNIADSTYFSKTLNNLEANYELVPEDISSDGGYASIKNLEDAERRGIKNIVFTKTKGKQQNKVSSKKKETILKKWRSGIEANISNLKRGFAFHRCNWKSYEGFQKYALWSVIAYNFKVLASLLLTI